MPGLASAKDYLRAVRTAARGKPTKYSAALHSVLLSRFRYGIGPRLHSLFRLFEVPRERWPDYLVDERLRVVLRRVNPPESRELVNDKLAFHEHCQAHRLSDIPVLCALQGRPEEEAFSSTCVRSESEWLSCLEAHGQHDNLFFKLVNGTWGIDAFQAKRIDGAWHYCGRQGSDADLYAFALKRLAGRRAWLVQPTLRAHDTLREITSPHALCTVRAITCRAQGEPPEIPFAALRIPVGDNVTDNFAHGASGNVIAAIDIETGRLGTCYGSRSTAWPVVEAMEAHPDTRNTIKGHRVPHWEEAKDLMRRAQLSLPGLKTVGWDIAVTNEGPVIVEANATYDVDLVQVAHQTGIARTLLKFV